MINPDVYQPSTKQGRIFWAIFWAGWSYLIHQDERLAVLAKLKGSEVPRKIPKDSRKIILEAGYLHRDRSYLWLSWYLFPQDVGWANCPPY